MQKGPGAFESKPLTKKEREKKMSNLICPLMSKPVVEKHNMGYNYNTMFFMDCEEANCAMWDVQKEECGFKSKHM